MGWVGWNWGSPPSRRIIFHFAAAQFNYYNESNGSAIQLHYYCHCFSMCSAAAWMRWSVMWWIVWWIVWWIGWGAPTTRYRTYHPFFSRVLARRFSPAAACVPSSLYNDIFIWEVYKYALEHSGLVKTMTNNAMTANEKTKLLIMRYKNNSPIRFLHYSSFCNLVQMPAWINIMAHHS